MISSRDIKELHPILQNKATKLIELCDKAGIDIILTSTYRDYESQNALYATGRTKPGKIVTKAKGGYSYHNFRVAFDVVPVKNGKAIWNDWKLWDMVGKLGQSIGLEWGGNWEFKDRPHFQYTQGLKLEDFRAGKNLK